MSQQVELDKSWEEGLKDRLRKEFKNDNYLNGASDFQQKAIQELTKHLTKTGEIDLAIDIIKNLKA